MPSPMAKTIQQLARKHGTYNVFADFVAMSAIAFSNAVDRPQFEKREAEYMHTVKKYDKEEANEMAHLLAMLTMEMEQKPRDVLGELFHELEIHNEHAGQFFTPWNLCQMMASITFADKDAEQIIEQRGYLTAHEPACGSGAMVIALADVMEAKGINYQQHLHVTAIDIDVRCVHMAYAQFSLLHIPATVIHGNALTLDEWSRWRTPAHIMGGWDWRLRMREMVQNVAEMATVAQPAETTPMPIIDLFDGAREVCKQPTKQKPDIGKNTKQDTAFSPVGTQLRLF